MREPLMKVKELAARLSVSIPSAYRLLQSGAIPPVRVGERSVRVREQDVEAFVEAHRRKKGKAA